MSSHLVCLVKWCVCSLQSVQGHVLAQGALLGVLDEAPGGDSPITLAVLAQQL